MGKTLFDLRSLPVVAGAGFAAGVNTSALVGVVATANLPSYAAYTPALTGSTSNPTLGASSSATGRYIQTGKLVHCYGTIMFGSSGVAVGSGNYRISVPVAVASAVLNIVGTVLLYDNSSGAVNQPLATFDNNNTGFFEMYYAAGWPTGAITSVTNAAPWTWAASDQLHWNITYEAA